MPLLRFLPYRDIALEIADRLANRRNPGDPLAPWEEEVLVASGGMAEAIGSRLVSRGGVAGLRLETLERFAKRILNEAGEFPRAASPAERRLAMRTAVRSIDDPMMESRGVAAMLERAYRDVRDSGVTLATFRARAESTRGLRNPSRLRLIVRAWSEYEKLIAQLHAIDPAELFELAAERIARGARARPQLVAGFYDMTGVQRKLIDALPEAVLFIPVDRANEAYKFAQPFIDTFGESAGASAGSFSPAAESSRRFIEYETKDAELRAVCASVRELLDHGVAAREIGIVARSFEPYDAHLLARFATEYGFRTTLTDDVPLTAHRIGRSAMTLFRLRERGFPRGEVLELVRDGLRTKTSIDVDKVDVETRVTRIAGGTSEELRVIRRKSPALQDYIALVKELEELTASIDITFLTRLPSLFRAETKTDLAAIEALESIAALFRRAEIWRRGLDVAAVMDAITNASLEQRTTNNEQQLVWAGELLRFRGRTFEHLFVVRMQDDVFPQRRNEDPLLPDADRRLLGVREIGDGRDEERLLHQLLLDGARDVRFSYAASDGFGKVLRKSRYLNALSVVRCPSRTTTDNGLRKTDNAVRALQLLARSGTRSLFDGYLPPSLLRERAEAVLTAVTPTQLEDFGECPQKFLFKHLLGVRDYDDPERQLQIHHRDKGTIDHQILERFYRGLGDEALSDAAAELPRVPQLLVERLESIIDEAFDTLDTETPPFNRTVRDIERRATKRILRDFVAHDLADLVEQGLVPRHFEYRFGTKHRKPELIDRLEPYTVDVNGVTIRIDGTIDRIDAGVGRFRIVDYKSGKALRHQNLGDKIDRGVRLQLPLYAMAVSDIFAAPVVSGAIKPLVVGDERKAKFSFDLGEKRANVLEALSIFVTSILKGVFPAFPNESDQDFNSCKYCPVKHSCRTKHDAEERYLAAQARDPKSMLARESAP